MYGIGFWLYKHARLNPTRLALVTPDRKFTYDDLNRESNRVAHALRDLGLGDGDRIGVCCLNYPQFLTLLFGAGKLGVVVVSLNHRLTPPEIAYQMQDSRVRALFVGPEQVGYVAPLQELTGVEHVYLLEEAGLPGCPTYAGLIRDRPEDEPAEPLPWEKGLLTVYTSGTTGKPKGAVLTHANQFWQAMNDIIPLRLTADDRVLTILPLVHVGGVGLFTLPTLLLGGRVILPLKFEAEETLRLIETERPTIVFGVPAIWQMLIAAPQFQTADLSSVRFFYNGGDRCPLDVVRAFHERGVVFGGGYGLTETSPTAFMLEPEDFERGTQQLGFIGKPAFFNDARYVNAEGQDVPAGEVGEIWLRGPNVFGGYWNQPEASADVFTGDWFHTGDLALHDADYLTYIVGRSKEMFKSGGLNVYPAEIEAVLARHPAVREVCVIGVPDPKWSEVGRAIVALKSGSPVTGEELLASCDGQLARFKIPKSVIFVDALPRNTLGKINRAELKQRYG